MKVKLYFGNEESIKRSGIGRALVHQKKALELNNIAYTTDKEDMDYDILHINTVLPGSYHEILNAKLAHKKIIYHAHSTQEDFRDSFMFSNALSGLFKHWLVFLYSKADFIITPTNYSMNLLEDYDIDKPILNISNGVDVDQFNPSTSQIDEFCNAYNIQDDDVVIVSVGWLFERKGFDTFVEVASKLPQYKFFWFGDVEGSRATVKIQKLLRDLPSNVILPGYVAGDVIKGAYGRSNVFFFPSREETEGIVVLEALACKCNVLLRDIPVFDDWLEDGETCFKGNSKTEFVELIQKIVSHEVPNLAMQGFTVAKERDLKLIGLELKKVYEKVLYS